MLTEYINVITITDILGSILALTTTILYAKNNIWGWIVCIAANLVNLYLFYNTGIYADAFLEFFYISIAVYGLYNWKYGGANHKELEVKTTPYTEAIILLAISIFGYILVNYILKNYTDSNIPRLDAMAMVLSLVGQWMAARKYIENWLVWLVTDSIFIAMFYFKGLPAHMWLNIIYLPLVFYGYYNWLKLIKQQKYLHKSIKLKTAYNT